MHYLSEDFLLHTKTAQTLYHEHAALMPILDYHCHLSPQAIAEDSSYSTITQVWLGGDHYKWRAMRSNGIPEDAITGKADDKEKFKQWANTLSRAVRNPLYDWTHLELKQYFGITDTLLSEDTHAAVYAACNEKLADKSFTTRNLLKRMNVKTVGTTDDPIDDLVYHAKIKKDAFGVSVVPTFRPDKALAVENPVAYKQYLLQLEKVCNCSIVTFDNLIEALDSRHAFFHQNGCRSSDNGFETLSGESATPIEADSVLKSVLKGEAVSAVMVAKFKTTLLLELCRMNHKRGWVQQFHFGVMRNVRSNIFKQLGADTGVDCIGDFSFGKPLAAFLDALDTTNQLTKTILFPAYPGDNEMLISIMGAFQDGSIAGKIQFGPPWWFLDQKDGFIRQCDALSGLGLLSRFIGMTTDSRSFLSFPRHEYFRRIICNILGGEMERGDLPGDMALIGGMVRDISYTNAKSYFGY